MHRRISNVSIVFQFKRVVWQMLLSETNHGGTSQNAYKVVIILIFNLVYNDVQDYNTNAKGSINDLCSLRYALVDKLGSITIKQKQEEPVNL